MSKINSGIADGKGVILRAQDSLFPKKEVAFVFKNKGGDSSEILFMSS